jgi:FKBP-type peptidyl-prolyl cis-trans isomerase
LGTNIECFDELEDGGEWFVKAKNLKDAVEKINMWTETEEEEEERKSIQNEKLEAAQAELKAAQAELKAVKESREPKTKKVTCENGNKINVVVTEKGYKVDGFFIQKISITNQWFNNVSRSVQYTSPIKN